jgi:hypothetical protein
LSFLAEFREKEKWFWSFSGAKIWKKKNHHIHMFGFHYVSEKYWRMITDLYFISVL